jgi:hypothetical protein
MQPYTSGDRDTPIEREPVDQVTVGMSVIDSNGTRAGTVTAVQPPGADMRPDMPAGVAEYLMAAGYIRIDGNGFLANDTYASGDQIAGLSGSGEVELRVHCDELHRATS